MMCKMCIEKVVLKIKGVKFVNWNIEMYVLMLFYNDGKINLEVIQKNIVVVGYDIYEFKVIDEVYNGIDDCCKY